MRNQTILVTGGAGFIGSNFIPYFLENYPDYQIVNLDLLTYAGDLKNLEEVKGHSHYTFIHGDICDRPLVESIFKDHQISGVIHFAAESHVDNSINNPGVFIETNVKGTFNLLDVAYKFWMKNPFEYKVEYSHARFHHISTDEVYGSLGDTGYFTEETPYAPNSPYSASKASSDMIVRSYHHTYGLNTVITNCSNNFGPKQHSEKLIPTIVRKALAGAAIPIYGNGKNVRDWLYVKDHVQGIVKAFLKGRPGEIYNLGGNNELKNIEIAKMICDILDVISPRVSGSYNDQITFVKDRAGHDQRYAVDCSKIKEELGWSPSPDFNQNLEKTIKSFIS